MITDRDDVSATSSHAEGHEAATVIAANGERFPKNSIVVGRFRSSRSPFRIGQALLQKSRCRSMTVNTGKVIAFFRTPLIGVDRVLHLPEHASSFDPETLRYHAEVAPVYSAGAENAQNWFVEHFISLFDAGSRIIDMGCGSAIDAAPLLQHCRDLEFARNQ